MAGNITQDDATSTGHIGDIHHTVGGKPHKTQFRTMELVFETGGLEIHSLPGTCSDLELEHSSTTGDSTFQTLDCSVTFENVRVYPDEFLSVSAAHPRWI